VSSKRNANHERKGTKMNAVYNKTRIARQFKNSTTFEGAQLVYFFHKSSKSVKSHCVILRQGANEDVIKRFETIQDARNLWAFWQNQLLNQGFTKTI
jgi:hypothetical protein